MRYRVAERRYYNYPTTDGTLFPILRKSVSIMLDMPGAPRIRGNRDKRRKWIHPERLQILWEYDGEWKVARLNVIGPDREGFHVFAEFDLDAPRVPKWIPPLVHQFWPIDDEVFSDWVSF